MTYSARLAVSDNLPRRPPGHDRMLSYLPACHVIALSLDGFLPMELGAAVYFADGDALRGTLVRRAGVVIF